MTSLGYSETAFELHGIAYGNGLFVAVGRPGTALTSTDGIEWSTNTIGNYYPKGVAYGNGVFVTVGESTNAWSSTDGATWTSHALPVDPYLQMDDVAFGNGVFVAVGDDGTIVSSTNGMDWTREHSPTATNLRDVTFGNGTFVIAGNNDQILQNLPATEPLFTGVFRVEDKLSLSWNGGTSVLLQQTSSLSNPDWKEVPGSLGTNRIELPYHSDAEFFRLIQTATP